MPKLIRSRPPLPARLVRYGLRELGLDRERLDLGMHRLVARSAPRTANVFGNDDRRLFRQRRWSGCYAPSTSMYFDQFGKVRACCQNTGLILGDATTTPLREIWKSRAISDLRDALRLGDFTMGCEFCAWQRAEVAPSSWFLRQFDHLPAGWSSTPSWPRQLEFSISNTCNLQCVMCNGDWSSLIRSRREHRAALPNVYPDRFFEELVEFIPHLDRAAFTGGEPFLGNEPRRIMELLATHGHTQLELAAVTNGTVWNERIERLLWTLRPAITVSLDGANHEVFERIRVGASFDRVVDTIDRLRDIRAQRPDSHPAMVSLTHCLMIDNWDSFPELLLFAEHRDLDVSINVVRFPEAHSLYHLSSLDLAQFVRVLDQRTPEMERELTGNRLRTWRDQMQSLRRRSESPTWPDALGVAPEPTIDTANAPVPVASPTRRRR